MQVEYHEEMRRQLTWFAAHLVIAVVSELDNGRLLAAEESIRLFEADSFGAAEEKAKAVGQVLEQLEDGLEVDGQKAMRKFLGVRKVVETTNRKGTASSRPDDGCELSYLLMDFDKLADAEAFVGRGEGIRFSISE